MIVLSYQRLLPLAVNSISLSEDGVFFYVDRMTYDSCVIINNKYTLEELIAQFPKGEEEERRSHVEWLYENMPTPINILAPYTLLTMEQLEYDIEDSIKALHVITDTISPYRYLTVAQEVRKDVGFSLNVLDEAELTTERALSDMVDIDLVKELLNGGHRYQPTENRTSNSKSERPVDNRTEDVQEDYEVHPGNQDWIDGKLNTYNENVDWSIDWSSVDITSDSEEELVAKHPTWVLAGEGTGLYMNPDTEGAIMFDTEEDLEFGEMFGETEDTIVDEQDIPTMNVSTSDDEKSRLTNMIM